MNHWQLVIQDIWSVAKYGLPICVLYIGILLGLKEEDDYKLFILGWLLLILN